MVNAPEQTAAYYRKRLQETPHCWQDGLELRRALLDGYHYPDADAMFRASTHHMPDDVWFAHYRDLALFHSADLAMLRARAERLLPIHAETAALHALLGRITAQQKDYAVAALHAMRSGVADRTGQEARFLLYHRLAALMQKASETGPPYAIAVINLDSNPERLAALKCSFSRCQVPLHRIRGVLGSSLSLKTVRSLGGDPGLRGTLGCFLSHVAAWEWILVAGLSHCLVVEDDVMAMLDLPANLAPLNLPPSFDICFVNDRLQPSRTRADTIGCVPVGQALESFDPKANAPGADGYILTAAGARKLQAWVKADGCADDVDWRLLAYSLSARACSTLPRPSFLWDRMDLLCRQVPRVDRLDAWVLDPALIRTVGLTSDREDENRITI